MVLNSFKKILTEFNILLPRGCKDPKCYRSRRKLLGFFQNNFSRIEANLDEKAGKVGNNKYINMTYGEDIETIK